RSPARSPCYRPPWYGSRCARKRSYQWDRIRSLILLVQMLVQFLGDSLNGPGNGLVVRPVWVQLLRAESGKNNLVGFGREAEESLLEIGQVYPDTLALNDDTEILVFVGYLPGVRVEVDFQEGADFFGGVERPGRPHHVGVAFLAAEPGCPLRKKEVQDLPLGPAVIDGVLDFDGYSPPLLQGLGDDFLGDILSVQVRVVLGEPVSYLCGDLHQQVRLCFNDHYQPLTVRRP